MTAVLVVCLSFMLGLSWLSRLCVADRLKRGLPAPNATTGCNTNGHTAAAVREVSSAVDTFACRDQLQMVQCARGVWIVEASILICSVTFNRVSSMFSLSAGV